VAPINAVTGSDGSYDFANLAAGTYTITETSPAQYLDGKDAARTPFGGTAGTGTISEIVVVAGGSGTDYDFSEIGLKLPYISNRLFLSSTPSTPSGLLQRQIDAEPVVQLDGNGGSNYSAGFASGGAAVAVVNNTGRNRHSCRRRLAYLVDRHNHEPPRRRR